jgi:hypothetical protein
MRTDPLPLVTRSSGPPPPIEPAALPFDTAPCISMPAMLTEPERLLTSTVTDAAASSPISTLPDPVEASHARVGPPSSETRPLWLLAIRPPLRPRRRMALDPVSTSASPVHLGRRSAGTPLLSQLLETGATDCHDGKFPSPRKSRTGVSRCGDHPATNASYYSVFCRGPVCLGRRSSSARASRVSRSSSEGDLRAPPSPSHLEMACAFFAGRFGGFFLMSDCGLIPEERCRQSLGANGQDLNRRRVDRSSREKRR